MFCEHDTLDTAHVLAHNYMDADSQAPALHGTVTLHHVTALPPGTCPEQAISLLHDHDFLIRLDPEFAHVEALPRDEAAPAARRYKITDHMHALPRGLWDSTVAFEANMTNTEDGIL